MKYLLMICMNEHLELTPEEEAAMGRDTETWVGEMGARGVRLEGHRLRSVHDATTVRVRNEEVLIADGPFAETKEQIAGYDIVECADLDEVIDVAAKHPVARHGVIEVRPFWPM